MGISAAVPQVATSKTVSSECLSITSIASVQCKCFFPLLRLNDSSMCESLPVCVVLGLLDLRVRDSFMF